MRIIRIFVILLIAISVIFPKSALANETTNTDTNTKNIFLSLFSTSSALAYEAPAVSIDELMAQSKEEKKEKTEEEIKNEEVLAKWKEKQADKWENLPSESFVINASAYTAAADECGKSDGITSSGLKVKEERTIACPQRFPFGMKLEIEGMGTYVCEDRGGAIKGNHIDIYMETKNEAFAFGRKNLMAKIVEG